MLVFLGIDALVEGSEIAAESVAGVFNGQILIVLVAILSFLVLMYASTKLGERSKRQNSNNKNNSRRRKVDKLSAYDDSIHASQAKKLWISNNNNNNIT